MLSQGLVESRIHVQCHEMCLLIVFGFAFTHLEGKEGKASLLSWPHKPVQCQICQKKIITLLQAYYASNTVRREKSLKNIISFNPHNKCVGYVLIIPFLRVKKLMLNHFNFQRRKRLYEIFLACRDCLS